MYFSCRSKCSKDHQIPRQVLPHKRHQAQGGDLPVPTFPSIETGSEERPTPLLLRGSCSSWIIHHTRYCTSGKHGLYCSSPFKYSHIFLNDFLNPSFMIFSSTYWLVVAGDAWSWNWKLFILSSVIRKHYQDCGLFSSCPVTSLLSLTCLHWTSALHLSELQKVENFSTATSDWTHFLVTTVIPLPSNV